MDKGFSKLSSDTRGKRTSFRIALALTCAVVTAMTPVSGAFAFGFGGGHGGGFGGGGHFGGGMGGGHFGGGMGGGMHSSYGGGSSYGHTSYMNRASYGSGRTFGGRSSYGASSYGGSHYGSYAMNGRHPGTGAGKPTYGGGKPPYNNGYPPRGQGSYGFGHHHPVAWGNPVLADPAPTPVYSDPTPVRTYQAVPVQPQQPMVYQPTPQPQPQPAPQLMARARSGVPSASETRFVPDEVMFTVSGPAQTAEAIGLRHNLQLISSHTVSLIGGGTMNRYHIPDQRSVPDVIRDLETEQQITWAQPNYIFKLEGVEMAMQGLASAQYALVKMHLTEAHQISQGDNALVAVIDSGIDERHSDLAGAVVDRFDVVGGGAPIHSHGTAIAGAISAHGALTGIAPHANILAIRAFAGDNVNPGADGTTAHIVDGLTYAFEHHARIVNMSFAGAFDPLLALAIRTAHQNDMILIAAAGNEGPTAAPAYPAADQNVIAVTATDRDDHLFSASNHGSYIALAAPGTDIIAAAPGNSYQFSSGTSIAAAHVTGVVALLLSQKPDLSADTVRRILKDTAHDIAGPARANEFGAGLGDASRAVAVTNILRNQAPAGKVADAN